MPLTKAEISKRYRERLKSNPEKYKISKEKSKARSAKCYREKIKNLDEIEKNEMRLKWRQRYALKKELHGEVQVYDEETVESIVQADAAEADEVQVYDEETVEPIVQADAAEADEVQVYDEETVEPIVQADAAEADEVQVYDEETVEPIVQADAAEADEEGDFSTEENLQQEVQKLLTAHNRLKKTIGIKQVQGNVVSILRRDNQKLQQRVLNLEKEFNTLKREMRELKRKFEEQTEAFSSKEVKKETDDITVISENNTPLKRSVMLQLKLDLSEVT